MAFGEGGRGGFRGGGGGRGGGTSPSREDDLQTLPIEASIFSNLSARHSSRLVESVLSCDLTLSEHHLYLQDAAEAVAVADLMAAAEEAEEEAEVVAGALVPEEGE